jgi:cell wall-associated NlpC family hydrolase
MSTRLVAAVGIAVAVLVSCGAVASLSASSAACGPSVVPAGSGGASVRTPHGTWTAEQLANATTIVATGQSLGVPPRGHVIAVATAMQESSLRNLAGGDRDSVGLFQQRPSQGWGTPADLRDPAHAASLFYRRLLEIPAWQQLPLTVAAQAVQHSATPDAYATWEPDASILAASINARDAEPSGPSTTDGPCLNGPPREGLPPDVAVRHDTPEPVVTAIAWAIQQLGSPYHFGGDCTNPHGADPAHHCDCSSLVQQAYLAAGIRLRRTAAEQSKTGTPVPDTAHLRAGDLLFVPGADGAPTAPGHVGIYLGDNLVLDAPHEGATVHTGPVDSYWRTDLTIRRVVAWQ